MAVGSELPDHAIKKANAVLHTFAANATEEVLDLSGLGLTSLPNSLFDAIASCATRVTRLNLANNALTTLPGWLARLPNLRILFLLGNEFTLLPGVLCELSSLRMLSFKHCKLSGELAASRLPPHLVWLILTDNQLSALSSDFGARCRGVRKLLLANNLLSALPASFAQLASLELLRLSNNPFLAVPPALAALPALTWLALGGTPACGEPVPSADALPQRLRVRLADFAPVPGAAAALGGGASGAVTHCRTVRGAGAGGDVAVKRFARALTSDGRALDEVAVLLAARGLPHVVRAVGFAVDDDDDGALWTVTELVPDARALAGPPSFASVTRDAYGPDAVPAPAACAGLLAAAGAVAALHAAGIVHGDVYAHNMIATDDGADARLCDFGAAFRPPPHALPALCQVEVRALGVLCAELADSVPPHCAPLVRRTARRCMAHRLERPSAQEVFEALGPLRKELPQPVEG